MIPGLEPLHGLNDQRLFQISSHPLTVACSLSVRKRLENGRSANVRDGRQADAGKTAIGMSGLPDP